MVLGRKPEISSSLSTGADIKVNICRGMSILLPPGIGNSEYRQLDVKKIYLGILYPGKKAHSM